MIDRGHHAVRGEEALHGALVATRLAPQHLERAPLLLSRDGVDDRLPALAQLSQDDERPQLAAVRDLVFAEETRDVDDARIDALARDEDDVDQRVELVAVQAPFGQRPGEARLAGGAPHLFGVEPEEALAHRGHFVERVEALELGAEDVDRRIHGGTGQQRWSRHSSEGRELLDLHTTSGNCRHFGRRERVSLAKAHGPPAQPLRGVSHSEQIAARVRGGSVGKGAGARGVTLRRVHPGRLASSAGPPPS